MFYADTPIHHWAVFGSVADRAQKSSSDFDVILCGVTKHDLSDSPYFADLMPRLFSLSVDNGKGLDLFLDDPAEHRLVSAFSERAIDAGDNAYRAIHAAAKPATIFDILRRSEFLAAVGRTPLTRDDFIESQRSKLQRLHGIIAKLPAKKKSTADSQMVAFAAA